MTTYKNLHLDQGESVILEVRKHWIVFVGVASGFLFAGLLPLIIFTGFKVFVPGIFSVDLPGDGVSLFLYLYLLWILSLWILFFIDWTKYYLDVWYVTEKRIIAVDQKSIFHRGMSNLRFDKIQDITVDVHGFIPTMLDFGNVKVQTAGQDSMDFYIKSVRHPQEIRKVIFGRQNKVNEIIDGITPPHL